MVALAFTGLSPLVTAHASGDVSYVDADGNTQTCSSYTSLGSSTTSWSSAWYVLDDDVTIGDRISVTGNATLILRNGKTLTASKGIYVPYGNSLTVYAEEGAGSGALVATAIAYSGNAAIGGNCGDSNAAGDICIYGGNVTAYSDNDTSDTDYSAAAAIGGSGTK